MSLYWYKKNKRVKKISNDSGKELIKGLKDNGYVQVGDKYNPEKSIIKKAKPKTKKKNKKK